MAFLDVEQVSKRFGGLLAVQQCTISVESGSLMGLIGPNGAGKSTLFNLISGLYTPETGSIEFEEEQIVGRRPDEIARLGVGRTFQTPRSFETLSCRENLLASVSSPGEKLTPAIIGAYRTHERRIDQKAVELLEKVGLSSRIDQPADELSGGELRMLEIARQLIRHPKLLLLDEPTAGVTPALQGRLAELLRSLHSDGMTVVVVEHNLGFLLNLVEDVVVMVNGRVLTQGPPDEIRRDPEVINAYLGRQDNDAG